MKGEGKDREEFENQEEAAAAVRECVRMFDVSRCVRNMDIFTITIWKERRGEARNEQI